MGLKSFIWGAVSIATLGIVQEEFHYVIYWDDGDEEHVWAHSIYKALWKLDYSMETAEQHMIGWSRLDENGDPIPGDFY